MKKDAQDGSQDEIVAEALAELRTAALAAGQRPESFWTAQRDAVLARALVQNKLPWKSGWAWVAAAVLVVVVTNLWLEMPRGMPVPDFAAGDDQELLYDVQRLIQAPVPLALEPAMMFADEIAAGVGNRSGR